MSVSVLKKNEFAFRTQIEVEALKLHKTQDQDSQDSEIRKQLSVAVGIV